MTVSRRSLLCGLGGAVSAGSLGVLTDRAGDARADATPANVLVAGSLLRVASETPGATVEAHGSAAVRRLLLNDMRDPDAVALADPRLFAGISDRGTLFATNALVLAYSPTSAYAADVRQDWATAIEREGLRLGRTDPDADPLGYRTVMALRLAASRGDVDARRVLERAAVLRETDLLNVVEGGKVDAAFAYRNMAVQRGLPYVSLPDALDFSNPAYADVYRRASYDLGETTVQGAPIRYAAAALTETGASWVEELVTASDRLRDAGFLVPEDYPRRDARLTAEKARVD